MISFVIFNAENMGQALSDIGGLFGAGGIPLVSAEAVYCLRSFALVLILVFLMLFYEIYMNCTPAACLAPDQWQKIWRVL